MEVMKPDEMVSSQDEMVSSQDEIVSSQDEIVSSQDEKVSSQVEMVSSQDEMVSSQDEKVSSSDENHEEVVKHEREEVKEESPVQESREEKESESISSKSNETTCCWICFGTENLSSVEVCYCKGNDSYVHNDCLLKWICSSGKTKCCKCNCEYNIIKDYSYNLLAYFSPFLTLALVSLSLVVLFHYTLCVYTSIPVLSVYSLRIIMFEIDTLAFFMITVAFIFVYYHTNDIDHVISSEDEYSTTDNTSLLQLLSKMFSDNFHLTGLEVMLLYNIESSFSFISIRLLLILYETIGKYVDNIVQNKFTKSTILPRNVTSF